MEELAQEFQEALQELSITIQNNFTKRSHPVAMSYIVGLLSNVERKNAWQLSEYIGASTPYKIQQFLFRSVWDADAVRDNLRSYVSQNLASADGVLVVDETGFLKKGKKSAGVKRQYSGTAGRVENCQIGVFLTYASEKGHTMIDRELYIPKDWIDDKERCEEVGIPDKEFRTKPVMALEMMRKAYEANVPFRYVTGDSVYGDYSAIRFYLEDIGKSYVLAVSGKAYIWRGTHQEKISDILKKLPAEEFQRISCGAGSKGDRVYDWYLLSLGTYQTYKRVLLVRRSCSDPTQMRAYLCGTPSETDIETLVRIAGIRWTVEMCFAESKGDVGLDHYEVRSYQGWYRHITLALLAHALLTVLRAEHNYFVSEILLPSRESGENFMDFKKKRQLL